MNKLKLKLQKQQLALALTYANTIEDCDNNIEMCNNRMANGSHFNYFKSVKQEAMLMRENAIKNYADVLADILESSIEISADFDRKHAKNLSDDLFKSIGTITREYAEANGIKFK